MRSDGSNHPAMTEYDDAPLRRFHLRVALASTGGVFADGFGLGIIGIALSLAAPQLALDARWQGLLGGASLAGLFAGALLTGPAADHVGRRPFFAYNMLIAALLTEFAPRRIRGRVLGVLSIAWAGGYACAYECGYELTSAGEDAWRWMLLISAVPCLLIMPLRITMPESPVWLIKHGQ